MDGDKTAQSNCLRISSQKMEELWGLKDERVVVGREVVRTMGVRLAEDTSEPG